MAFAGYLFYGFTNDITSSDEIFIDAFDFAKAHPISLRDGSSAGYSPSFADFGLVLDGCKVSAAGGGWLNGTFEVPVPRILFFIGKQCYPVAANARHWPATKI